MSSMRSIVACNKSLSVDDRLCDIPGTPRDTVYPWGKGAHKQTSEHYRLRHCDLKSTVCDVAPLLRKLCLLQIPHLHHLCCTKKLQQTKSTRYCVSCAFLLLYLVFLSLDKIFEFNSCISALFSKNRS